MTIMEPNSFSKPHFLPPAHAFSLLAGRYKYRLGVSGHYWVILIDIHSPLGLKYSLGVSFLYQMNPRQTEAEVKGGSGGKIAKVEGAD